MRRTTPFIAVSFVVCILVVCSGCATTPAPDVPVTNNEEEPAAKPDSDETKTDDSTRPKKGETIDLGIDGPETGNVVIESGDADVAADDGETAEDDAEPEEGDGEAGTDAESGEKNDADDAKGDDADGEDAETSEEPPPFEVIKGDEEGKKEGDAEEGAADEEASSD